MNILPFAVIVKNFSALSINFLCAIQTIIFSCHQMLSSSKHLNLLRDYSNELHQSIKLVSKLTTLCQTYCTYPITVFCHK